MEYVTPTHPPPPSSSSPAPRSVRLPVSTFFNWLLAFGNLILVLSEPFAKYSEVSGEVNPKRLHEQYTEFEGRTRI